MSEPPARDPLAEHPLGDGGAPARPRSRTLDLFPDVGQTPLTAVADASTPNAAPRHAPEPEPEPPAALRPESPEPHDAVAFARRVAAGLADLLILALVGAVVLTAGALLLELRFPPASLAWAAAFLALVALVLLVLAPFVWGTTPGMALADLRIRAEDGGLPTLAAAFRRLVGFALTFALAGVPLLVAAFDRRGRTLADLLSGTTVAPLRPAP